ncbi:MAG: hypothetical protein LBL38_01925 [Lactobacillales bacterium]|jgi:hypothetical protein|nr:hypothetical protein [Lactobacillales bacterium]
MKKQRIGAMNYKSLLTTFLLINFPRNFYAFLEEHEAWIFFCQKCELVGSGMEEIWQNFSQSGKYYQNHS